MKWFRRIFLLVLLIIVAVCVVAYFSINSIIRSVVERQATASLGVNTSLESAHLSIFGGQLSLQNLLVSSPPNFTAPQIFTLGGTTVSVRYGQLTGNPIHVEQVVIDHPVLVIEQANVQLNLNALLHQMPQTPKTSSGQETQPIKLVIDELDLNDAQVTFLPGIPGLANSIQVPVASLTLKDIGNDGGNQNGAAIRDVVLQTSTALAAKAVADSKLSPPVKLLISQELSAVSSQLGSGFAGQFQNFAGTEIKQLAPSLQPKLQSAVNQLLGGGKSDSNK